MKALSLFSGIGGTDLSCEWAGIETVAFCEREPFPQKVLKKNWPNVPIYDDVCTLTKERLDADGIGTIDIILSGDPCQPYSHAGNREGFGDDRALWPEVNRILETVRPRWIVRENVIGNVTMGLDKVFTDLDDLGYTSQSFIIPACAVGADHERNRVFVIGHSNSVTERKANKKVNPFREERNTWEDIARQFRRAVPAFNRLLHQPAICRASDGFPERFYKDRMKALGNAVNPFQIYPILAAIKQIDDMLGG